MRLFDESNHSATHKLLDMGGLRMKLSGQKGNATDILLIVVWGMNNELQSTS